MAGQISIYIGFATSLLATLFYFLSYKNEKITKNARILYNLTVLIILFMSAYLITNIIGHNYQIAYIYKYSSNELSFGLLLSTFFAGQEGSFLLWLLFYALAGVILIFSSQKIDREREIMSIYSLVPTVLFLMLMFKSPFISIWEAFPNSNIPPDLMPHNGSGLNPILENYWMIIHPPILFAGYVLVTIPYAISIAGLIRNDKNLLAEFGYKWTLLGTGVLGAGLMLGGFWAYETLGWGGFWGWDPVENSSLLPWLSSVALVHTMLVQRKSGGLIKTNYFLAVLTFCLVLYATFLTRSGILGDFSVHSFVDPGTFVYTILLSTIILFTLIGLILILYRFNSFSKDKKEFKMISKENFMAIGSILILLSLGVIFYGTSFPIISSIFSENPSSVEISYYNRMNLPIYIIVLLFTYITPFMRWKSGKVEGILKKSIAPIVISVLATFLVTSSYDGNFNQYTVLIFASFLSFFANLALIFTKVFSMDKLPALVSHMGLALLIVGAVISGYYEVKKVMVFDNNSTSALQEKEFTYTGYRRIEKGKKDREKYKYTIIIDEDAKKKAEPVFYWSQFNDYSQPFLEPGIYSTLLTDYYISPNSVENKLFDQTLKIALNESQPLPFSPMKNLKLLKFDLKEFMSMGSFDEAAISAVIEISGKKDTLTTVFNGMKKQFMPVWKSVDGLQFKLGLSSLLFEEKYV